MLAGAGAINPAQSPDVILTVAGGAQEGFAGDGGRATAAQLRSPCCVAVDSLGNLYITDAGNHRIRKVTPEGTITTLAGTGEAGYSGDGGPAQAARLRWPGCMALDSAGNLYFADTDNHRIRKITPEGAITTVAGTGRAGFAGDGGTAASALLSYPTDVALDSAGHLYIADTGNHRIRKVTPEGTITTLAGAGKAGFAGDNEPATSALLSYPSRIAVDSAGHLYIADTGNHRIRKVTPEGTITTLAGTGKAGYSGDEEPAASALLNNPFGLAVDSAGHLYIADTGNSRIRMVAPSGTITTLAGSELRGYAGDGGPATSAQLNAPFGIAVDAAGNLFIADTKNHCVRRTITPTAGALCVLLCSTSVPASAPVDEEVSFSAAASAQGCTGAIAYQWDITDEVRGVGPEFQHTFSTPGTFTWTMTASLGAVTCSRSGTIAITEPVSAGRLRIRALDELRTPSQVSAFPGQTLYWHFALENEAGEALSAATASAALSFVGFTPSPDAFRFLIEQPGHLVLKADVDKLNLSSSAGEFSFRSTAGAVRLDGQPYDLTESPPAVSISLRDPPIVNAWEILGDLSATATGCLGTCRQPSGNSPSVAAAWLSGSLPGSVGLRLQQDQTQLSEPTRGLSLTRRFPLSEGARLKVPALDLHPPTRTESVVPVGASTSGSYGLTATQSLSYPGNSLTEARLLYAASLLESLSLAKAPLPPLASPLLTALLDSLQATPHLASASRSEWTVGTSLEGRLSDHVSYPGLWGKTPVRLRTPETTSGTVELHTGATFGRDGRTQSYMSRIRWAEAAETPNLLNLGNADRFGTTAASLLGGAKLFGYSHEAKLSPSLEPSAFETSLSAADPQDPLDFAAAEQSLTIRTVRYHYEGPETVQALHAAIPPTRELWQLARLAASEAPAAVAPTLTLGALQQLPDLLQQMREAAQQAGRIPAYELSGEVVSLRKAATDISIEIPLPAAGQSIRLRWPMLLLRERKARSTTRAVVVGGREWKLWEWNEPPDETSAPDFSEVLRHEIFAGLGSRIEEAWRRRVTYLSAPIPTTGLSGLEVRDRVTGKLTAAVNAPASHAGKAIRILSYSPDRPEAAAVNAQGCISRVQWRYTSARIAGQSHPTEPGFTPSPSRWLLAVGNAVELDVAAAADSAPLSAFDPPLSIEFALDRDRLARYGLGTADVGRVQLYRYDPDRQQWSATASATAPDGPWLRAELRQPGVYLPALEASSPTGDSDQDGRPDEQEDINRNGVLDPGETHPYIWDTDGDGVCDGEEQKSGADPTSASSCPNRPPVLAFIGNRKASVGAPLELQLTAHDEDGDRLSFYAFPLPPGAQLEASSGRFRWTPAAAGEYRVEFQVSDGTLRDSETVLLVAEPAGSAVGISSRRVPQEARRDNRQAKLTPTGPGGR